METKHKAAYEAPFLTVEQVKTEASFLGMSQRNYTYRSLDEDDIEQEG